MQKSINATPMILGFLGLCMMCNGLFVLGQSSFETRTENGWRRTTQGWEHADSLPIRVKGELDQGELQFPTLTIALNTVNRVHRLALPLAISGFMACLGPWLLIRWPTQNVTLAPSKNAQP